MHPPFGAHWLGDRTRVRVHAPAADGVTLCLFDPADDRREVARVALARAADGTWVADVADAPPGTPYGLRAAGPWRPDTGLRFNPAKLLVDPWALAMAGPFDWHPHLRGDRAAEGHVAPDPRDSAAVAPRALVAALPPAPEESRPSVPWADTVIYECHVKGMTARHPEVPPALRGTFLGLASEPVVEHLRSLGVTTLELMPVQQVAPDPHVAALGLVNYWGYNTLGFLAPDQRFAAAPGAGVVAEFREMVRRLHAAGIEVVLDIVLNHTGEAGRHGSTLAWRGLDNAGTYLHVPGDPATYLDTTGTGNTVDFGRDAPVAFAIACLRYWVEVMGVDGFRFDLATTLLREGGHVHPRGRFVAALAADPVLSRCKLIAEPWDLGPDGYRLGGFPPGWAEWNGAYREQVRRFWRGDPGTLGMLATRLAGSSDLFGAPGRGPLASVNYVTSHDGLTLRDLVSYAGKHNEANGEGNRDGPPDEGSANWGEEGETARPHVLEVRERVRRSLVATLAFSLGVPMLAHGDELGRTQAGNSNAYCHDGPLTWVDWDARPRDREFAAFVTRVLALRRRHPAFRRAVHVRGDADGDELRWFRPDGAPMAPHDWNLPAVAAWLRPAAGEVRDDAALGVLLLLNGGDRPVEFTLPAPPAGRAWHLELDTAESRQPMARPGVARVAAHALVLLVPGEPAGRYME